MIKKFKKLSIWKKRFTALILGIAIILVWRGIWGLADLYLFPNSLTQSFIISIVIGLVILMYMHYTFEGLT
jgi:hypothetical protein|tara:strand:- start:859 stop:1071 length:213 start_codon:yes stop_codon:yes gene_type:complete